MSDVDEHNGDVVPDRSDSAQATADLVPVDPVDQVPDRRDDRPGSTPGRRSFDWKLWIASLPIAVGVLLIAYGVSVSITGDEATKLPEQIESIAPVPDAVQVLAQTNIVVDLEEGYEGRLTIDDVEFPTQRLEDFNRSNNAAPGTQIDIPAGVLFEGGNDTLTFTPGPDIAITKFTEGNHTVRVVFWRASVGEQEARSYSWSFNVI
jgi:hypothetical protein